MLSLKLFSSSSLFPRIPLVSTTSWNKLSAPLHISFLTTRHTWTHDSGESRRGGDLASLWTEAVKVFTVLFWRKRLPQRWNDIYHPINCHWCVIKSNWTPQAWKETLPGTSAAEGCSDYRKLGHGVVKNFLSPAGLFCPLSVRDVLEKRESGSESWVGDPEEVVQRKINAVRLNTVITTERGERKRSKHTHTHFQWLYWEGYCYWLKRKQ